MHALKLGRLSRHESAALENALHFITHRFAEKTSPENLAREVGLGVKKLQAGFKTKTGYTIHDYLIQLRLAKAKELLSTTDDSFKSITEQVGFANASYFGVFFKKLTGVTPNAFRLLYEDIPPL